MSFEEIRSDLLEHIRKEYDLEDDPDLTTDVNLFDFGFLDSMCATEVIAWLEEKYSIEITQKDIVLYPMNSIDEIAEVVSGKVN